ncbi:ATP-binding protein [Neptuniibacter pectenicola]|uniref:ATP-binding protein n=1 Tax=Neptuniibacter pectenicola TaxID=1806669 RepID=UPI000829D1F7|nr:ATP-binding protein [Neptuniibacter pectenicola]
MNSIRAYLTITLVIGIGLAIAASIAMSYQRITHETEELYDAELAQISRVLEAVLSIEFEFTGVHISETTHEKQKLVISPEIIAEGEYNKDGHKYEKKLAFQVWSRKGVPLLGSSNNDVSLSFSNEPGYSYETIDDKAWRTFVRYSDTLSIWIKVSQSVEIREDVTHKIASVNASILLILLPVIFILITLIVRKGLAPLNEINRQISLRGNNNLTPLNFTSVPNELQQIVGSINHLMSSLGAAIERQRRFTGNAAHELRTPLAAIKVHAQNMHPDNERLKNIQDHIVSGIDKLTHLFNQLITLSQAECSQVYDKKEAVNMNDLVCEITTELSATIHRKQITLSTHIDKNIKIQANREKLSILLRNLIDNAVKYVPDQGKVTINAELSDTRVNLSVSDNGIGLNQEQKAHVFERFYRASSQDMDGCGIGLSIVKEICDSSGYSIALSDTERYQTGLTVTVGMPNEPMATDNP